MHINLGGSYSWISWQQLIGCATLVTGKYSVYLTLALLNETNIFFPSGGNKSLIKQNQLWAEKIIDCSGRTVAIFISYDFAIFTVNILFGGGIGWNEKDFEIGNRILSYNNEKKRLKIPFQQFFTSSRMYFVRPIF